MTSQRPRTTASVADQKRFIRRLVEELQLDGEDVDCMAVTDALASTGLA